MIKATQAAYGGKGAAHAVAWRLVRQTLMEWLDDKGPRLGASLAYYTLFSIGPLLVVLTTIAALVFDRAEISRFISSEADSIVGAGTAAVLDELMQLSRRPHEGVIASAVAVVVLLIGALGLVVELKDALNTIWNVPPQKEKGAWSFVRTYVVSAAAIMGLAFLLMVSLIATAAITAVSGYLLSDAAKAVLEVGNFVVSFAVTTVLFALMFKYLPDVDVSWRDVWIGAVVTALLFNIGKLGLGLYLGSDVPDGKFGTAAAVTLVLLWVYYCGQIVLLGAEFTQVFARNHGKRPSR